MRFVNSTLFNLVKNFNFNRAWESYVSSEISLNQICVFNIYVFPLYKFQGRAQSLAKSKQYLINLIGKKLILKIVFFSLWTLKVMSLKVQIYTLL